MRIAYIITAYQDPEQLYTTISALIHEGCDFFIHIDKKVDMSPFVNACSRLENVSQITWIEERQWICWGGLSQVKSILKLLEKVFLSKVKYDRIVCISGTDYPIYSNEQIITEFEKHPLKQYLIGLNISNCQIENIKQKINRYWFFDFKIKNLFILKFALKEANKFLNTNLVRFFLKKDVHSILNNKQVDIYFGSDYWALTYECAKYLFRVAIKEVRLMKYLKFCFVPSELFVQTILFNSKYCSQCESKELQYYEDLQSVTPLHYINIKYPFKIQELDESYFEKIIYSKKMFFRKASSIKSKELIKLINELQYIKSN
jgi:hypothetical protein